MVEYKCKRDGEVYCLLDKEDTELAKQLIGCYVIYHRNKPSLTEEIEIYLRGKSQELTRLDNSMLKPFYIAERYWGFIACKKSDLNLPEEKPKNDGWLGYFEADSDEAKALIGKEVEISLMPMANGHTKGTEKLLGVNPVDSSYRYRLEHGGSVSFVRPIKEKPLKPVNENCLFKPVLVKNKHSDWIKHILAGSTENNFYVLTNKLTLSGQYGHSQIAKVKSFELKRCPNIKYGDEDE